jgi:hypothetical protein
MLNFFLPNHAAHCKPPNLPTCTYWLRLQMLQMYKDMMPGNQPLPSNMELQESSLFYGQPSAWQAKFNKQYDLMTSIPLNKLLAFKSA